MRSTVRALDLGPEMADVIEQRLWVGDLGREPALASNLAPLRAMLDEGRGVAERAARKR